MGPCVRRDDAESVRTNRAVAVPEHIGIGGSCAEQAAKNITTVTKDESVSWHVACCRRSCGRNVKSIFLADRFKSAITN
jgi:hypothetical protein